VPNDAKLGLVLGVSLVIAVGVVFFRKDLVTAQVTDRAAGAVVAPAAPPAAAPPPTNAVRDQLHPVKARTADRTTPSAGAAATPRGNALLTTEQP
jgi:hypothetical protein